jgi:hypothetical protein
MDGGVGQESNMTSTLDGQRQLPLVFSAIAGNATGDNLAAFGHKEPQSPHILVIDPQAAVGTESTDLAAVKRASFSSNNHGVSPYDRNQESVSSQQN